MNMVFQEIIQRYGLKTEFPREKATGKINGYNCSIEYINNSYNIQFNVSNTDVLIINNLRRDIFAAQKDLVYVKNPIVNSGGTSFEINDKEYVDYSYFAESYITTDILSQILDYICRLFSAYSMSNTCVVCGRFGVTNTYEVKNENISEIKNMCDICAISFEKGNDNDNTLKKRVLAIVASFVAGLIFAIIYALVYSSGYIYYISGFVIAGASVAAYSVIAKERVKAADMIIVSVITIFCCFIGQTAGFIGYVYNSDFISATLSETIKFSVYSLSSGEIFGELIKNTLILLIPAVIINIVGIINISKISGNRNKISGTIRRI